MNNLFKGLITAIITPFKGGELDFIALEKIIEYQATNQVKGIVVAGSTGEGTSLNIDEYNLLTKASVELAKNCISIIAGCCSSDTRTAKEIGKVAKKNGVQGLLCTVPPYVKPSQEGLYEHFKTIHEAVDLPIMLYSVPSRTAVDLNDDAILKLSELPRILALKDAGRDLERPLRLSSKLKSNFNLLSGNDEITLSYNAQGGVGCISVASNIAPQLCKKLQDACQKGDFALALKVQQQLLPLYKALFSEANPIPVKYAAHYLGLCSAEIRLPLTEATSFTQAKVREEIDNIFLNVKNIDPKIVSLKSSKIYG